LPALDRRHSGELERHRQDRYKADVLAMLAAIDAIPEE
jgi:hypothetical protein